MELNCEHNRNSSITNLLITITCM